MEKHLSQKDEEISLSELVEKFNEIRKYLLRKWFVILVALIAGAGIGLTYALLKPVKYESRISFVVEDNKAGVGGLAAIAGQFGFDIGGGAGGGVFAGDNILLFLKSESLCRETLLTDYDSAGKEVLADKYAEASKLKASWAENDNISKINFAQFKEGNLPRLEDSLMQLITKRILAKDLTVEKPDKKASFVDVKVAMHDELLSKYFGERLVKIATDRYVDSKTKLKSLNVAKLQRRADSLGALLNNRTYTAAATQQSLLDVNPGIRTAPVTAEITTRDKTVAATIYGEVVKNLEIAKVALSQETPTIQLVDRSSLPLKKDKASKLISIVAGGVILGFISVLFLIMGRWWRAQTRLGKKEPEVTESNKVVYTNRTKTLPAE